MRWLGLWIGIAVVALAVGAGALWVNRLRLVGLVLKTQNMPGFDVDLPFGRADGRGLDYNKGRLTIAGLAGTESSLQLTWEPGGLYGDDLVQVTANWLAAIRKGEARPIAIGTPVAISGPGPTRSWAVRVDRTDTWATQVACGLRRVTVITGSAERGVEQLHRRIARSIRCRPDAAKERLVGDVPVVFDLGPGWFHLPDTVEHLQITDRHTMLSARIFGDSASKLADIEPMLTTRELFPGFKYGARVGDAWPIEATTDGDTMHGWVVVRACPDGRPSLILMSLNIDGGSDDEGRGLLARGRCRKPNEPRQTWPELPKATAR